MTVHVTIALNEAEHRRILEIARNEKAPVEEVIADLVSQRLRREDRLRAEIQKGVDSAEREPLVDNDDVFATLRGRILSRAGK